MKAFFRKSHQGRSGYLALMLFVLAYAATLALVLAPDHVKAAMDLPSASASN